MVNPFGCRKQPYLQDVGLQRIGTYSCIVDTAYSLDHVFGMGDMAVKNRNVSRIDPCQGEQLPIRLAYRREEHSVHLAILLFCWEDLRRQTATLTTWVFFSFPNFSNKQVHQETHRWINVMHS